MPEARAAMPTIPRSRAAWLLRIPVRVDAIREGA